MPLRSAEPCARSSQAAFVGGYLLSALKISLPIKNTWLSQIVTATVGAIVVVIVARLIAGT